MPNFQTIWNNHPNIKGETPLLDPKVYANQCAINLSAALIKSQVPLTGFRGIIFFQNYWGTGNQGDHIDLWNGTRLTHWSSWARIQLHISGGSWSDYRKAEAIWFWGIS